jgi:hypothetical protein
MLGSGSVALVSIQSLPCSARQPATATMGTFSFGCAPTTAALALLSAASKIPTIQFRIRIDYC